MTNDSSEASLRDPAANPRLWQIDPEVTFLNHGSFGSCPRSVLEFQQRLRDRLERQPLRFLIREFEPLWDEARRELASFLTADADDLVFIPNATTGVNTVLRSLSFAPGDELLVTNHEYNACRNALDYVAQRSGARVVVAELPFPFRQEQELIDPILEKVTSRTRIALIDHITSQTGLVLPIRNIVQALAARGVDTLVDGAHAPGMVPVSLRDIGAAYYTGNCHKWLCAPKGAAFLHVRPDRQEAIRPLAISHGANSTRRDRSGFLIEFGWTGTFDPTAYLSVPAALRTMAGLRTGGWPEIMRRNHQLVAAARRVLCASLECELPCPEEFLGSLASVPLPRPAVREELHTPFLLDPWQDELLEKHRIEVPIIPWPRWPRRLLRVSAQLYNSLPQYERLVDVLRQLIRARSPG